MIGQSISHYKILEKLGEGGMGIVYKAQDTKLDRLVALKFLPPTVLVSEEDSKRFQQEAKALSALNNPHIATVYNIHEENGKRFIVLEYLPGGTLKSKLSASSSTDKGLPLRQIVDYALQIAEGLAHAHKRGIVHRDIKTDNIMLTEEQHLKITDFGLAMMGGSAQLTRASTTVGTAAYMSPEQIRGEDVDHRSDLFSFGIVLYEIATGRRPFRGEHEAAIHYSIVQEDPHPITSLRSDLPPELVRLIERCLVKNREERFQTADEIMQELGIIQHELLGDGGVREQRAKDPHKSIAVLPFVDMSVQKDQEYFGDGIAEELIGALTRIPTLRVAAQTSAFSFKGKGMDIREIGRKLNVETVLEGSIRKAVNRLRITAQLVDVHDGYHLWSERYDRELGDVFAIQDEITLTIVDKLKVQLFGVEKESLLKRPTENLEAFNLYLKGRYFWNKRTANDIRASIAYFQQAIEKDTSYALAYAGLSDCYCVLSFYSDVSQSEAFADARAAASRALELDPLLAEAHTSLAAVKESWDWAFAEAEKEFQQALKLNPNYATAHHWYGLFLARRGQFELGITHLRRALDLDPFSLVINLNLGVAYYLARQPDAAIKQLRKTLELDSAFRPTHIALGQALREKGLLEEAIQEFQQADQSGSDPWALANLGHAYALAGKQGEASRLLENLTEIARRRTVPHACLAIINTGLGDKVRALEQLEQEFAQHSSFWFLLKTDPVFESLRNEPGFIELTKRIGLRT